MMINREMSNKEMMKNYSYYLIKIYITVRFVVVVEIWMKTIKNFSESMENIKQYKDKLFMFDTLFTLQDSNAVINKYKPDIVIDDYIQLIRVQSKNDGDVLR